MAAYGAGHSYAEFRNEIRGLYPEIVTHERGSLGALNELCRESCGIGINEEGRLQRFGLEFCAMVSKCKTLAVITNRDACQTYLNVLDPVFSRQLRQAIIDRKLLRVLARQAGVLPVAQELEPHVQRDDPILLQELVEIAEALPSMDVGPDATLNLTDGCQEVCQLESMQSRVDECKSGLHAELQDALGEIDRLRIEVHALQRHTKKLEGDEVKDWRGYPVTPSTRPTSCPGPLAQYANVLPAPDEGLLQHHNWANGLHTQRRECHYCNLHGHFADACPTRAQHLANGWILGQDSQRDIKLFDGRKIPRGRGSPAWKVTKPCRHADLDMKHSNVSVERDSEDRLDTILSEVRAVRKEMEEMIGLKDEQDLLLLNYWRSEWARCSDRARARRLEEEQFKSDTEDVTEVEDKNNVLDTCSSSEQAQVFELRVPVLRQRGSSGETQDNYAWADARRNAQTGWFCTPRPWEKDVPTFNTHNIDDLVVFLQQVDTIIELRHVGNEQERKVLLTKSLQLYPEIAVHNSGALESLDRLCVEFHRIRQNEEGRLRRFGIRFCSLVKQLQRPPALVTNRDACTRYLRPMDSAFTRRVCRAVEEREIARVLLQQLGIDLQTGDGSTGRREDAIALQGLVQITEAIARTDVSYLQSDAMNRAQGEIPARNQLSMNGI
ncbi:hypothetical protein B0H17DRAFT_1129968 [Mycena rosella]|uniref:CCHC-type domain-containing protein n=1 Tax=Mycena rosella TaxID=1033263 RepID=A0AAD7DSB4_MYCRO|nr:hypothetical protein B0H17DRAFT_1129968 [Mycena rosella]